MNCMTGSDPSDGRLHSPQVSSQLGTGMTMSGAFDVPISRDGIFGVDRTTSNSESTELVMSYPKWCALLVANVLKSRTPFAAFLQESILLSRRGRSTLAPTFFPIPLPYSGLFDRMPAGVSATKRRLCHLRRAVHVICMALNFWHSGFQFGDVDLLRREPNSQHRVLYGRLASFIRSDGLSSSFSIKKSGRRIPNLIAKLGELSELLTKQGSVSPYEKSYAGVDKEVALADDSPVEPFSDLCPERLMVHGTGSWDATSFLSDALVMPYREPGVLEQHLLPGIRPSVRDPPEKVAELAHLWDKNDLLYLHRFGVHPASLVKVFNCVKSKTVDRQIGDRRGRNSLECKLQGPSRELPSGPDIQDLHADPRFQKLCLSVTDRRDFYHQLAATESRARSNTVGPQVPLCLLKDTKAYGAFLLLQAKKGGHRAEVGDHLNPLQSTTGLLIPEDDNVWVAFKSIFQGDHAGVEICTDAHVNLLQSAGLLSEENRLISSRALYSPDILEGLVIDDYFCISREDASCPNGLSRSRSCYDTAAKVYKSEAILGSPSKDILGENHGKAIGACLNSSDASRALGLITVGSPAEKRISMSFLTLQMCRLKKTTDTLMACLLGGWVSMLTYRRPLMSVLNKAFKLVDSYNIDASRPKVLDLPRSVANELVVLAALIPLMVHEISADYDDHIYATDASSKMGAVCSAPISREVSEVLWRTCKSKGAYTRLLTKPEALLRRMEIYEEKGSLETCGDEVPPRPLAFTFDFIEIFAGSAKITAFVSALGVSTGPPIDLSYSPEYDVARFWVINWLSHLVKERMVKCFAVEPPCTTFSIMRRPRLRSSTFPFGFNPHDLATNIGNVLAFRSGQLMYLAHQNAVVGLWETPFSSYMRHLRCWKIVAGLENAREVRADSCRFGSPHLKSFRFLVVHGDPRPLQLRCRCTTKHVQICGSLTKGSAIYADDLAKTMAKVLVEGAQRVDKFLEEQDDIKVDGLENQLVNEVMLTARWKTLSSWTFRRESHINLLEEASLLRMLSLVAKKGGPRRVVAFVDSFVVRGATSKGRSSSVSLSSVLRRVAATCAAAGIYLVVPFCPTRLNVADDPTRDAELRSPLEKSTLCSSNRAELFALSLSKRTRRWASNWMRLVLLSLGPYVLGLKDSDAYRRSFWPAISSQHGTCMDFDATLGFPGEGPFLCPCTSLSNSAIKPCCCFFTFLDFFISLSLWILLSPIAALCRCRVLRVLAVALVSPGVLAMPNIPQGPGDLQRASRRMSAPNLPEGRPVQGRTGSLREKYFSAFENWVRGHDIDLDWLLDNYFQHVDDINALLSRYGRELFAAGKTYNQFAETINELTSRRPPLRRLMQGAWDIGYAWRKCEPSVHHVAMPSLVLMAALTTALTWGWTRLAGAFSLMWGGLLRPGELCGAFREDLLLPCDMGYSTPFCLLAIKEPKTRFSNARHQSAKLDISDLMEVVSMAFKDVPSTHRLWPFSAQTLRNRLKQVLEALQLPSEHTNSHRAIDLGSFRAGGATYIIQTTEDGDLLQRRGRWANRKMMEIYVQEVSALMYLKKVEQSTKDRILTMASAFPEVLRKTSEYYAAKIPSNVWHILLSK